MNGKRLLLLLGLLCVMLTACSRESEPAEGARTDETTRTDEGGSAPQPTQTIELSLSGTVDEEQLRSLRFDMDGNELPKIRLASLKNSSGKVPVQCVLRGEGGGLPTSINYVTIPFDFDETTRKLSVFKYVLSLPATAEYSNLNGRRWYVTGCIGGTLSSSDHKISIKDNYGPHSKHGTALTQDPHEVPIMFPWTEISFKESGRGDIPNVTFSLRGALLRIKWVNDLAVQVSFGQHAIYSNAFGTDGYFKMDAPITAGEYPPYVFDNTDPGEHRIAHSYDMSEMIQPNGGKGGQGYFLVWVMPRATAPTNPKTYIRSTAQSTGSPSLAFPATKLRLKGGTLADYTTGVPQHGKTYLLEAHISGRPALPIEFATSSAFSAAHPLNRSTSPESHFPVEALPSLSSLPGWDWRHHIPTFEQWTAIFPYEGQAINFTTASSTGVVTEKADICYSPATYSAEYVNTGNKVTYAIRYAQSASGDTNFPAATSDILRCAYRYEMKSAGGWGPHNLEIRVRYLGADPLKNLSTVSSPGYWATPDPTEIVYTLPDLASREVRWTSGKYGLYDALPGSGYWVRKDGTNDYSLVTVTDQSINATRVLLPAPGTLNPSWSALPVLLFRQNPY